VKRLLAAVGIAPPVVALAVLALLGAQSFGARGGEPRPEAVWGAVPQAWLDGLLSLRAGDAAAALRQLSAAETACGVAPPPLLRARLGAALAAGDWVDAELTAEKLALRAGEAALRDFVVGLAEYARSERAGLEAEQPGADPTAFDRAIRHATAAALAFQAASLGDRQRDWAAARRNAERAAERRADLQRKQEQAQRDREQQRHRQEPEPDPAELEQIEQELKLVDDAGLLSPAELQALLQRLARAVDVKRGVRLAARSRRSAAVEHDW
jgi:hypothetical protein